MTFTHAVATDNYGPAKFIVSANAYEGTHTTIAAALTSASSGDTIFIRPGTYTENLTLKAGVNLCAFGPFDPVFNSSTIPNVIINGKCTFTVAGTVGISGICLQTNSDFALAVTGSAASIVDLNNCYIYALNNTAISFTSTSASSQINMSYCGGDIGTTGIALFAFSGNGYLSTNYCYFENDGHSLTANTVSGTSSEWFSRYTTVRNGNTFTGTSTLQFVHCEILVDGNQVGLTFNSTGIGGGCYHCFITGGTSSAVSIGAGATLALHYVFLSSSNASTVAGTGTLQFSNLTFNSGASLAAGLTLSLTSMNSFISGAGVGTSGQILTSNGASSPPTWQAASGGLVVQQIRSTTATAGSTATTIPYDNTIPQSTEGAQLLTVTITPTNSSHILVIEYNHFASTSIGATSTATLSSALFQDSTANAIYAQQDLTSFNASGGVSGTFGTNVKGRFSMTAGTTSSTTFKLRVGPTAGTYYWLQDPGGARFSTSIQAVLTVTEYTA